MENTSTSRAFININAPELTGVLNNASMVTRKSKQNSTTLTQNCFLETIELKQWQELYAYFQAQFNIWINQN